MPVALRLPPSSSRRGGGGGSRWVPLCKAADDIEAHLLVGRLHEAGVETHSLRDRGAPGAWLYGGMNPWASVTVYVRSFQLEEARFTLAEVAYEGPAATDAVSEPLNVSLKWWATALLLGAVLSGLAIAQMAGSTGFCQLPILCEEAAK